MTNKRRISSAVARPTRTALQATPALVLTEFVDAFVYDLNEPQYGALVGLLTVVLGWLQTFTENKLGRGLLRDIPDPSDPVPGDAGDAR